MKCSSFEVQPFISLLGLCSNSPQVPMFPRRTCQAAPLFVFRSNVGTDLDKGDGGVYFLHLGSLEWRGGKLKTGFTRFLETVKQAGGPAVREKGQREDCVTKSQTETTSQQISNMCESISRSVYVPVCVRGRK